GVRGARTRPAGKRACRKAFVRSTTISTGFGHGGPPSGGGTPVLAVVTSSAEKSHRCTLGTASVEEASDDRGLGAEGHAENRVGASQPLDRRAERPRGVGPERACLQPREGHPDQGGRLRLRRGGRPRGPGREGGV